MKEDQDIKEKRIDKLEYTKFSESVIDEIGRVIALKLRESYLVPPYLSKWDTILKK